MQEIKERSTKTDDLVRYSQALALARSGRGRPVRLQSGASLRRIADAVSEQVGRPIAASTIFRWEQFMRVPRDTAAAIAWMDVLDALLERAD